MRINGDISDLFFNHDHGNIEILDKDGRFADYDDERLRISARQFIGYLERLHVPAPSVEDLVDDFLARV